MRVITVTQHLKFNYKNLSCERRKKSAIGYRQEVQLHFGNSLFLYIISGGNVLYLHVNFVVWWNFLQNCI